MISGTVGSYTCTGALQVSNTQSKKRKSIQSGDVSASSGRVDTLSFDSSSISDSRYGDYTEINPLYESCFFIIKY